jgi:hypothetical protein
MNAPGALYLPTLAVNPSAMAFFGPNFFGIAPHPQQGSECLRFESSESVLIGSCENALAGRHGTEEGRAMQARLAGPGAVASQVA